MTLADQASRTMRRALLARRYAALIPKAAPNHRGDLNLESAGVQAMCLLQAMFESGELSKERARRAEEILNLAATAPYDPEASQ